MPYILLYKFNNRGNAVGVVLFVEIQCSAKKVTAAVGEIKIHVGGGIALNVENESAKAIFPIYRYFRK